MKRTDITAIWPDATEEQIKTLMDINGADINRAKGDLDTLRTQLSTAQSDLAAARAAAGDPKALEEANNRASALQAELDKIKGANAIRDMREKVSTEHKVPASLLTGDTEDACVAQAKAILDFAKTNPAYPSVKDGGDVAANGGRTSSAWQDFAAQISK